MVMRWVGVDTAFTNQHPARMTWHSVTTANPYRCVWTNELR
jgi:hypothetical protein